MFELFVGKDAQHIGLIFCPVGGSMQFSVAVVIGDNAGVMTGDYRIKPQGDGTFQKRGKFDFLVTAHAGVGGSSRFVFGDKVVDHIFLETLREVPYEEGYAQLGAYAARIHGIFKGAAPTRTGAERSGHARKRQMHANHLMPRLNGTGGSNS